MAHASILLIGGGVAGLSVAWALAQAGIHDVVLLEREEQLGQRASARSAAILRTAIEEPTTAELGRRSKAHFLSPPAGFSSGPLLLQRGLVLMANQPAAARELERVCAQPECGAVRLELARLRQLAPHITTEPRVAFWIADDGVIDVNALLSGFERGATLGGVRIRRGAQVQRILVEGGRARGVELADGERLYAERTVVAAGAWAAELAAAAGSRLRLRPTRRHLLVTAPHPAVHSDWPVVWNGGDTFYTRPEAGGLMLSVCDEVDASPNTTDPVAGLEAAIHAGARRHLAGISDLSTARLWVGLRTLTRDDRFAIGADPDVKGLSFAAGLGGHGMTCSFEAGRLAAAHLAGRGAEEPLLAALDPARLCDPEPARPQRAAPGPSPGQPS